MLPIIHTHIHTHHVLSVEFPILSCQMNKAMRIFFFLIQYTLLYRKCSDSLKDKLTESSSATLECPWTWLSIVTYCIQRVHYLDYTALKMTLIISYHINIFLFICLPPQEPRENPLRVWSSSRCRAKAACWQQPSFGCSRPAWREGWAAKIQPWLCFLRTVWWGWPSPPATTGDEDTNWRVTRSSLVHKSQKAFIFKKGPGRKRMVFNSSRNRMKALTDLAKVKKLFVSPVTMFEEPTSKLKFHSF